MFILCLMLAIEIPSDYREVDTLSFEAVLKTNGAKMAQHNAFGRSWTLKLIPFRAGLAQINLESEANQLIQLQVNTKKRKRTEQKQGEHWEGESLYLADLAMKQKAGALHVTVNLRWYLSEVLITQRRNLLETLKTADYHMVRDQLVRLAKMLPRDPVLKETRALFEQFFRFPPDSFPIRMTREEGYELNVDVPKGLRSVILNGQQQSFQTTPAGFRVVLTPGNSSSGPITLVFEDRAGHRLERKAHIVDQRKQWAVIIYHEYAGNPTWGELTTATDKDAWLAFFQTVPGLDNGSVKVLGNLSWKRTRDDIRTFLKNSRRDDLVVVFFAGHGARIARENHTRYNLIFGEEEVDINEVFRHFNDVSPGNHLFLFDSCFSGASWESGSNYASSVATLPILERSLLIAGASRFQPAFEVEGASGGVFTTSFLAALSPKKQISVGTVLNLYNDNTGIDGEDQNISIRNQLPPNMFLFRRNGR